MWSKKTRKTVWIILLIAILPGFVLWGLFDSIKRNKDTSPTAGKIYGKTISTSQYKTALQAVNTLAIMRFGDNLSQLKQYLNLEEQAWQRLIILEEAAKRKITASDKEVIAAIQGYEFFSAKKGGFDNKRYQQILRYVLHVPARAFEEQVRGDLIISKLFKTVVAGVTVTDAQIKEEYAKANESFNADYIAALPAEISATLPATDNEIKSFYTANNLLFKKPLSYNLEYVMFEPAAAETKLREATRLLAKATDFPAAAKELNLPAKETGLFPESGPIPGIGWSAELIAKLTETMPGKMLPVIKTNTGLYIMRLKEKKEPYIPAVESIKEEVKKRMLEQKSRQEAKLRIEKCLEGLKAPAGKKPAPGFEQLAKSLQLKTGKTGDFKFGSYIEGIGASDAFYNEAKKLSSAQNSGIIETPSGFYIIRVGSFKAVDEKKFAQDKNEFSRGILNRKQDEFFSKYLEDLVKKSGAKKS